MSIRKMYQVSTLQALAMGYFHGVIRAEQLLAHGDIGLGTFENVAGEMIVLDGKCYQADQNGHVREAAPDIGVPFAAVTQTGDADSIPLRACGDIEALKVQLTLKIEEDFGLNFMHAVRIDGYFPTISARSETAHRSAHVELKTVLADTQKDFLFENIRGTLVCIYYPDYLDGINASGWHLHFLSDDRTMGGHVFDLRMEEAAAKIMKIASLEIQLPNTPAFDTYALKSASQEAIREVEQGKNRS